MLRAGVWRPDKIAALTPERHGDAGFRHADRSPPRLFFVQEGLPTTWWQRSSAQTGLLVVGSGLGGEADADDAGDEITPDGVNAEPSYARSN